MDNWNITYPAELEEAVNLFKESAPQDLKARRVTIVLTGHGIKDSKGNLSAGLSKPKERKINTNLELRDYYLNELFNGF